jgi:hypothetical protein
VGPRGCWREEKRRDGLSLRDCMRYYMISDGMQSLGSVPWARRRGRPRSGMQSLSGMGIITINKVSYLQLCISNVLKHLAK